MKIFKLIISIILSLTFYFSLSSCSTDNNYEKLYHELESEYDILEEDYLHTKESLAEIPDDYTDIIEYYEFLCKENGLLTYDQSYYSDYYYSEPGALICHIDFYCKKANSLNLQIVDIFSSSALEECSECDAVYYDIRLLDPVTKLYHHTYEVCAPHFTKDFKTISTPYIATTEQKAKELKYTPCPICITK